MKFLSRLSRTLRAAKRAFYDAAESHRLTQGFRSNRGSGPDLPTLTDGGTIRDRIYGLERNNAIMDNAIRSFVNGVLPTEIAVEPFATRRRDAVPGDAINRAWNDPIQALWERWALGACDFSGWVSHAETFAMLQRKVVRSVYTDSEIFVVRRRRSGALGLPALQVELIESDRLGYGMATTGAYSTGDQRPGVEYDANGRPAFYNFTRATSFRGAATEVDRVPARDVLHIFLPHRPGAQAGKLSLASCLMAFFHTGNVVQSEIQALDYLTRIAGVVTGDDSVGEEDGGTDSAGDSFQLANTEAATIYRTSAQGNFTAFKVDRPAAGFDKTIEVFLRFIAAGSGVPFSILAANYTGLSYTVSRAEMMSWEPMLRVWQQDILVAQFVSRVYDWFIDAVIMEGIVPVPFGLSVEEIKAVRYKRPRRDYIDPQTEVQADILQCQAGFASPQEICAARGKDFYKIVEEIDEARRFAAKHGVDFLAVFAPPTGSAGPSQSPGLGSDANNAVPPPQSPRALPETAPDERRSHVA